MTECGLLMPLELKQEQSEDRIPEDSKDIFPKATSRETENVSPQRRSPQETTDEESDIQIGTDDGLTKEASVDLPPVITVKCGTLTAKMVTKLFTCPGIHQNCILIDGETEYISPKEFTVRANKDKQKDWKGSIRIGKSNLRTLMEMRSLDFHDHPNQCSAKCQSRNYITPKDPTADPSGRRRSSTTKLIPQNMFSHMQFPNTSTSMFTVPNKETQVATEAQPTLGTLFKNPTFSRFVAISQNMKNNNFSTPSTTQTQLPLFNTTIKDDTTSAEDVATQIFHQQQRAAATSSLLQTVPPQPSTFWNPGNQEQNPQEMLAEMINAGLGDNIIDLIVSKINNMRDKIKGISTCPNLLLKMLASLNAADTFVNTIQAVESIQAEIAKEEQLLMKGQAQVHRLSSDFSSCEDEIPGRKRSLDIANIIGQPAVKRPSITTSMLEDGSELSTVQHLLTPIKPIVQIPKPISPQEMLMNLASSMGSTIERNHVLAALQATAQ